MALSMVGCTVKSETSENIAKDVVSELALPFAEEFVKGRMDTDAELQAEYAKAMKKENKTEFIDSRVNSVAFSTVLRDPENEEDNYFIFSVNYALKASSPGDVVLAGGLTLSDDGWLSDGMSTSMVLKLDSGQFVLMGGYMTEFSAAGNDTIFQEDFERWLSDHRM